MVEYQQKQTKGLSQDEVERSRRENGSNTLTQRKGQSFFRRFLSNLNDPVIRILLCALVVKLVLLFKDADVAETVGIAVAVFLAALPRRLKSCLLHMQTSVAVSDATERSVRSRSPRLWWEIPSFCRLGR